MTKEEPRLTLSVSAGQTGFPSGGAEGSVLARASLLLPNPPIHIQRTMKDRTKNVSGPSSFCGAEGIRTPDLLIANETRYQLRHSPSMRTKL